MNPKNLLKVGIIGTTVTAICCFTPVLLLLLTAIGLTTVIGYIDIVLLPALGLFIVVVCVAIWRLSRARKNV